MSKIARAMQQAAAGASDDPIHKVFSIDAWYGNQSSQTINNGVNLASGGGLVIITPYEDLGSDANDTGLTNSFFDTARGDNKILRHGFAYWDGSGISDYNANLPAGTDNTSTTLANSLTFTNSGYTIGSAQAVNYTGKNFHAYTFKKSPRFFDIVTWTGNGSSPRTLTHNLKTKPGMIWSKNMNDQDQKFGVYHHFASHTNTNSPRVSGWTDGEYVGWMNEGSIAWGQSDAYGRVSGSPDTFNPPTATQFTVGGGLNTSGKEYVAYLWGHDADNSNGQPRVQAVSWANPTAAINYSPGHPQAPQVYNSYGRCAMFTWVNIFSDGTFMVIDQMSGMNDDAYSDGLDYSKTWHYRTTRNYGHHHAVNYVNRHNNKLKIGGHNIGHVGKYQNNHYMVGMCITDPTWSVKPSSPSDVFTVGGLGSNSGGWDTTHRVNTALITSSLASNMPNFTTANHLAIMSSNTRGVNFRMNYGSAHGNNWFTDISSLYNPGKPGFYNTGVIPTATNTQDFSSKYALGFWKESKGYHSVDMYQTFAGGGTNNGVNISLGTIPEFMIVQSTVNASVYPKIVYHKYINSNDANKNDYYLEGNNSKPAQTATDYWGSIDWSINTTSLSSTNLYFNSSHDHIYKPGDSNTQYTYIVWAWGSKPGFSKFGAYTGNGNATGPSIDCGFSAGARCVMIKNVSEHQAWLWVNPSASGNDTHIKLAYHANNETLSSGTLADNGDINYITNEDVVDKTSNGFQIKGTNPNRNKNGDRYIYGAWA